MPSERSRAGAASAGASSTTKRVAKPAKAGSFSPPQRRPLRGVLRLDFRPRRIWARTFFNKLVFELQRRLEGIRLPETEELEEIETMIAEQAPTWTEMWKQQGLEEGLKQGESRLLLRQLERRFGPLDEHTRQRVEAADAERLLEWGERFVDATVLRDVFADH